MTSTTSVAEKAEQRDTGGWIRYGILAGGIAGIAFAMFEMVIAAILDGADALFMPLRMIGAMLLGQEALDPTTPLLTAAAAGLVIHMILSMLYGVAAAAMLSLVPQLSATRAAVIVSTSVAGFALWILNFYIFAPIFGWQWFPEQTNVAVQVVAHTFMFGTVLGVVLDLKYFHRPTRHAPTLLA